MKTLTKLLSVILTVCMLFSLCACHGKDETALTIEGEKITSALYLNAFIDSINEAKGRVDEQIESATENGTSAAAITKDSDYYSKSIDGVKFEEYVKNKTIERCKEYVFYKNLVDKKVISLTEEEIASAESNAKAYWGEYGYLSLLYDKNGVSYETYKKMFINSGYYAQKYFDHLYKEGGEKEVSKDELKKHLKENYALASVITAEYEANSTDDKKAEVKKKLEGYAKRIQNGEDFEKIYLEHSGQKAEDHKHETSEDAPKLQHAMLLADEKIGSQYAYTANYEEVFDLKVGETLVMENETKSGVVLYVKADICDDEYWLKNLTDEMLSYLKKDEFPALIAEKTKNFKVEKNDYAVDRFEIEDIDFKEYNETIAAINQANAQAQAQQY